MRAAGAKGDIVDRQVVADAAGGIVAQRQRNLGNARCGGKGKPVRVPLGIDGHLPGFANGIPIDLERYLRLNHRCGHRRQVHRNDIDGKLIQGIFANRHLLAVEQAGLVTGVYHHHVPVGLRAIVLDINPGVGGKPAPGGSIVGDGIITVVGRRVELIGVPGRQSRIEGQDVRLTASKIAVRENIFPQVAAAGTQAGNRGLCRHIKYPGQQAAQHQNCTK